MIERSYTLTIVFTFLVGFVLAGLFYLGYFINTLYSPVSTSESVVTFVVEEGVGVNTISASLHDAGLIKSKWTFEVYLWMRRWEGAIQAGTYQIPQNITIREVSDMLVRGEGGQPERVITIIEGWTLEEIENYLVDEGVVSREDFKEGLRRVANHSGISILSDKPSSASLEGYLFPDSYRIFEDATAEEIVRKMVNTLDAKFTPEMRAEVERTNRSIYDTLKMASILEREIRYQSDLPVAADVFYKRLEIGQLLQSDATLNYVLHPNDRKASLTYADLESDSPYNSYKFSGLPPTPISNPGLNAILAAVYPGTNEFYYFLTTPEGRTIFSKTFEEHNANKQKYLK
jgi:UPF0755 protein